MQYPMSINAPKTIELNAKYHDFILLKEAHTLSSGYGFF